MCSRLKCLLRVCEVEDLLEVVLLLMVMMMKGELVMCLV